jgi:hypothetical protein
LKVNHDKVESILQAICFDRPPPGTRILPDLASRFGLGREMDGAIELALQHLRIMLRAEECEDDLAKPTPMVGTARRRSRAGKAKRRALPSLFDAKPTEDA